MQQKVNKEKKYLKPLYRPFVMQLELKRDFQHHQDGKLKQTSAADSVPLLWRISAREKAWDICPNMLPKYLLRHFDECRERAVHDGLVWYWTRCCIEHVHHRHVQVGLHCSWLTSDSLSWMDIMLFMASMLQVELSTWLKREKSITFENVHDRHKTWAETSFLYELNAKSYFSHGLSPSSALP